MTEAPRPLAVLVKGWPRLSETFIAQELVALEEAGIRFELWSLRRPTDKKTHPLHRRLSAPVRYLPEYLRDEPRRVWQGILHARRLPGWKAAWRAFRADLRRDRTPNRVRRFGQACVLCREVTGDVRAFYAHFLHTPSSVARYASILTELPWSFAAHAKDIWTSPDWELSEKLSSASHGAAFGATCTSFGAAHLRDLSSGTPVDLVYHGLDLSRFPVPPERPPRSSDGPFRMLSVGRLVEKKGFDRLIEALTLLPDDLVWQWVHIGGSRGDYGAQLKAQADELGVSERILWMGSCDQPEVIAEMRKANLFVLPSRVAGDGDRDGLPNVLMEAASQSLPILSTPVSAIPEFITNGTHGLLRGDAPPEIAEAMVWAAHNPLPLEEMAEAALTRLKADFTMAPGIAHLRDRLNTLTTTGHTCTSHSSPR